MAENKMAQVAELFGKKLGERFKIRYGDINKTLTDEYIFTPNGLRFKRGKNLIIPHNCILEDLLTGEAEIVKGEENGRE